MTEPGAPAPSAVPRPAAASPPRAALSRELSDFLIDLSIALHKHAMYPGGHPTLGPAAEHVARRLAGLLTDRPTLSLGVARDQLVIEGVATDAKHPVLRDLAERLHRHHLGAVSYARGVDSGEIEESLRLLAGDETRGGKEPLGLRPLSKIATWAHIRLYPLTFDRLQLLEPGPEEEEGDAEAESAPGGVQAAQLWVGLARAALASGDVAAAVVEPASGAAPAPQPAAVEVTAPLTDAEIDAALDVVEPVAPIQAAEASPAVVAQAIESHERGTAYDQVIVGYMLQIADELKQSGATGAAALKRRMSRLISALDRHTLGRLLEMGGDLGQRRQFILDASQGMAVDAVVDLVKAASDTGAPISRSMLRMLTKLGHHAERGPVARRAAAETDLREQVAELVQGWALADPNPGGYGKALEKMAQAAPALLAPGEAQFAPEAVRLLQMACEAGGTGETIGRAVDRLMVDGRLAEALDVVERAPQPSRATTAIVARAATPEAVRLLAATLPTDYALLDRVLAQMGAEAAEPLLDVLAQSESRQGRRALLERLIKMGPPLGRHLVARLGDERWFVVRNLLYLAAELPAPPEGLNAASFTQHADFRVRWEALRLLFKDPALRSRAICSALTDADARARRLALGAVAEGGCPGPAVPLIVNLATEEENPEMQVAAVRALGAESSAMALETLLRITRARRSIIGTAKRMGEEPVYLAALEALGRFAADRRARERLEAAAESREPVVARVAAEALERGGAGAR